MNKYIYIYINDKISLEEGQSAITSPEMID